MISDDRREPRKVPSEAREAVSRDEKFARRERLLKTRDFSPLYKKGESFRRGPILLYKLANALEYNRIGFSISSKNIKLATRRNRARRLLREAFRRNKRNLRRGFDLAVVVKRDLRQSVSYKEVEELFLKLVKEAGILA